MLILTRSYEQSVIINGNIKVIVLGVDRGYVKLGFEAPDDVEIMREELLEKDQLLILEMINETQMKQLQDARFKLHT